MTQTSQDWPEALVTWTIKNCQGPTDGSLLKWVHASYVSVAELAGSIFYFASANF